MEQNQSRQVTRRALVALRFTRYDGAQVPKDLLPRKERRKLARARAAGDWRVTAKHNPE